MIDLDVYEPEVYLIAWLRGEYGPEELVAYGANACIKRDDPLTIYKSHLAEGRDISSFVDRVLDVTIGSGHLGVLDQASFTFVIRNVPRLTTLFLVSPIYLSHLQQSMRSVEPYGYYLPPSIVKSDLYESVKSEITRSIQLYYKLVKWGVPKEDARYVIPLYTVTNIQTTGNGREFTHLYLMSLDESIPTVTKLVVSKIWEILNMKFPRLFKNREVNMNRVRYYPALQLFNEESKIGKFVDVESISCCEVELINYCMPIKLPPEELYRGVVLSDESLFSTLKLIKFMFAAKMSFAALHQAIRQRTWHHVTESIYEALERLEYVTPKSIIQKRLDKEYSYQVERLYDLYNKLIDHGIEKYDAVGVVSHAHVITDVFTIDGWNIIGALPLRRCLKSQWEIRKIANNISLHISMIDENLAKLSMPPCIVYGKCSERYPCDHKGILMRRRSLLEKTDLHD